MGRAFIEAVEAIYSHLEVEAPSRWIDRVLPHVSACLGWQQGGYAHAYDLRGPTKRWKLSFPVTHDLPPEVADTVLRCFNATPHDVTRHLFVSGAVGTFSNHSGMTFDEMPGEQGMSGQAGVRDCAYVNAANPDGDGVLFCITCDKPRSLTPQQRRRLSMVAAHVAAAQRLLRALAKSERSTPAAIFEADGRVAHAEEGHEHALPLLRKRILTVDRARGRMRRTNPDDALASWEALLRGEYSTIDRFESDQRRYVVAFVNEPRLIDPRGLTKAEGAVAAWAARGHPEKLIAYELGLAQGTVSALLSRAYVKLGVRSRAELVRRFEAPTDVERMRLDDGAEVLLFSAPSSEPRLLDALTPIEREVARSAARGADNRSIAEQRGVSVGTVAKQLASAYVKLGVSTRAELARLLSGEPR